MNPQTTDKLQKRLEAFGKRLSLGDRTELMYILRDIAKLYWTIADVYKNAEIKLIPETTSDILKGEQEREAIYGLENKTPFSPVSKQEQTSTSFTPSTKQNKGNPLAELLHNMSEADKAKLVGSLETNLKKE